MTLIPTMLEDCVCDDNPVRVIDVFVEELDLGKVGFEGGAPASTGRPAYPPGVLLRLYIYGYLNRIQSSRRLEREAQHPEQRSRLQTMPPASNIIVPSSASKPVRWSFASRFGPLAAAAACIGLGGYWLPSLLKPEKEQIVAEAVDKEMRSE